MAGKDFNLGGFIFSDAANLTSGQIAFPAAQNASSNANTLDDYEEGFFTPAYISSAGAFGTIVYTSQLGYYTKIGRHVFFHGIMATSSLAIGTASGNVQISGLPFTVGNYSSGAVGFASGFAANRNPTGLITPNAGTTMFIYYRTGSATDHTNVAPADMATINACYFNGQYSI